MIGIERYFLGVLVAFLFHIGRGGGRKPVTCAPDCYLQQLWKEWRSLEVGIAAVTKEIEMIATADEGCRRLVAIPGVGPLVATALVAAVADATGLKRGRDLLHGSVSSHDNTRPAADRRCSACRSAAIVICDDCSSMAQGRPACT